MSCGIQGCLAQISAVTNLSLWLDVAPQCTFFQQDFCRPSPYAFAECDVHPQSGVRWGGMLQFEIPRAGDLLAATFLKLKVRGLRFADDALAADGETEIDPASNALLTWVPSLGHACVDYAQLDVGQIAADKLTGRMMEILEQHRAKVGNEQGKSIGSFRDGGDLRDWSYNDQVLHIALHFFFFEHPELYLPILALSGHPVRIRVQLYPKNRLINASDDTGACLNAANVLDSTYNGDLDDAVLVTRLVCLDQYERNLISAETHELVIMQHQGDNTEVILAGTTQKSTTLSFSNAVIAMFTYFTSDKDIATDVAGAPNCNKDFFAFSVPRPASEQPPWITGPGASPLRVIPFDTYQLKFNGQDRIGEREAEYFAEVMPFLHATKKTYGLDVIFYAFHMDPLNNYQYPAGHAMFSRIHEVKQLYRFKSIAGASIITALNENDLEGTVGDGEVSTFVMKHNVLRISMGQALIKFS